MADDKQTDKSSWNDAQGHLRRINDIITTMNFSSYHKNVCGWYDGLCTFFREISPFMSAEVVNKNVAVMGQINTLVLSYLRRNPTGWGGNISPQLYLALHTWDMSLRKFALDAQLLTALDDTPDNSMDDE